MPLREAIELMLSEEARVPQHLMGEGRNLERSISLITRALRGGGRLFYVGAGTSGRLGVLDASECPPTFSTPPTLVQAIMAGGGTAFGRSREGAEDDWALGGGEIAARKVTARDAVVGIAASGTTPFVWGALDAARRRGAATILLCFNPFLEIPRALRPRVVIAPDLGPDVLTGSTRLKAGTATKLVLNLFSTLTMVQLGKVRSNLMVDLHPNNAKLRQRAIRIVCELTGADETTAQAALDRSKWRIVAALKHLGGEQARQPRPRRSGRPARRRVRQG
jgi:N-acetylmuramic acid 6-phosphate etherase